MRMKSNYMYMKYFNGKIHCSFQSFCLVGFGFFGFCLVVCFTFFDSSFTDMLLLFKLKQNVCFKTS